MRISPRRLYRLCGTPEEASCRGLLNCSMEARPTESPDDLETVE